MADWVQLLRLVQLHIAVAHCWLFKVYCTVNASLQLFQECSQLSFWFFCCTVLKDIHFLSFAFYMPTIKAASSLFASSTDIQRNSSLNCHMQALELWLYMSKTSLAPSSRQNNLLSFYLSLIFFFQLNKNITQQLIVQWIC